MVKIFFSQIIKLMELSSEAEGIAHFYLQINRGIDIQTDKRTALLNA